MEEICLARELLHVLLMLFHKVTFREMRNLGKIRLLILFRVSNVILAARPSSSSKVEDKIYTIFCPGVNSDIFILPQIMTGENLIHSCRHKPSLLAYMTFKFQNSNLMYSNIFSRGHIHSSPGFQQCERGWALGGQAKWIMEGPQFTTIFGRDFSTKTNSLFITIGQIIRSWGNLKLITA